MRSRRLLLPLLLLLPLGCPQHTPNKDEPTPTMTSPAEPLLITRDPDLDGVRVLLSEADPSAAERAATVPVALQPLSDQATAALLARLPDLPDEGGVEFALRKASKPRPRTGETVAIPFPPEGTPDAPAVASGPPSVLRFAPEGEVPVAPQLSVTFDRPMIALTSQDEAAAQVLVQLEPTPPGQWRWIGTRTLLFEPDGGFPRATHYTATVPAGTPDAQGQPLAEAATWAFATPPLKLVASRPGIWGPQGLTPVIVLLFDQAIDPAALLPHLSLRGAGDPQLRIATAEELQADPEAAALVGAAPPDRVLALRAKAPLKRGQTYEIVVAAGAPSAEGPRTPDAAQSDTFFTYDPLEVKEARCGWRDECGPDDGWTIEFNNPLDEDAFDPALVTIEPDPGLDVTANGRTITIHGSKPGRTKYRVSIDSALRDEFGQTLERGWTHTFSVGPAPLALRGPQTFVVLDPAAEPGLTVHTVNHESLRVRVWSVQPGDYGAFSQWMRGWSQHQGNTPPPGRRLADERVSVDGTPDAWFESTVSLKKHLPTGTGQLVVWIEPSKQPRERWAQARTVSWVQATQLGLSAHVDSGELIAWASDLRTGASRAGVEVAIEPSGIRAVTDAQGVAVLPLPTTDQGPQLLTGRVDGDVALLPQSTGYYNQRAGWTKTDHGRHHAFFVFTDRGLYRPGERVSIKGYARQLDRREGGDVEAVAGGQLAWSFSGPRGNDIAKGTAKVSALGGFDLQIDLPDDVNLGTGWLDLRGASGAIQGGRTRQGVEIQEFRRPEFEVGVSTDPGPHVLGSRATSEVGASYFAGGGLANAEVSWDVSWSAGSFSPPGRSDWSFGTWVPWWERSHVRGSGGEHLGTLESRTDGAGTHRLRLDFVSMNPPRPVNLSLSSTVLDVNRQAWSSTDQLLLHPADRYVGLRAPRPFVQRGQPLAVELIAVDLEGAVDRALPITARLLKLDWRRSKGRWVEVEEEVGACTVTSKDDGASCSFTPPDGGSYKLVAALEDASGRANRSELRLWVAGGKVLPNRGVAQQAVTLVPSGQEFQPGDVAEVLAIAPFEGAEGLLTLRRQGIVEHRRFAFEGTTATLRIPIDEAHVPDLTLQVDAIGQAQRADDAGQPIPGSARPAFATGNLQLTIPPLSRTLSVEVTPQEPETVPGAQATVDLVVLAADGSPAKNSELAVVVVDESILSLTGYSIPDPLQIFYALRGPGATDHHLRASLLLAEPGSVAQAPEGGGGPLERGRGAEMRTMSAPMPASAAMDSLAEADFAGAPPEAEPQASGPAIAIRSNFEALAAFEPSVLPDAQGRASVSFALPDSLTRYRVMVVAVAGSTEFGQGESTITARKPLMVRPSPPRFLNFGDVFELPVVLQNQTSADLQVDVAVRSVGFSSTAGGRVTVPADDRIEVRFPATAQRPGTARWQAVATAAGTDDAAEGSLPIWTPATTEAFATYGQIDDGAITQPVAPPGAVWPQFGGLEITTSSTAVSALTDAVITLANYPFECSEQLASRVLAVAALQDVLTAFDAEGLPEPEALRAQVQRDIELLVSRQRHDGGYGLWRKHERWQWPYATLHVIHALQRAEEKGFEVPKPSRDRNVRWLREVRSHIPSHYGEGARRALEAYALYLRHRTGDADPLRAKALLREVPLDEGSLEVQGWLLPTLDAAGHDAEVDRVLRHWSNRVSETAAGATFTTSYGEDAYLLMHSSRRTDGVLLDALIAARPDSDLIPKVVHALLAHRSRGQWGSTQDNAWVLLALDRYFHVYESVTPDFVARAWLGDGFAGEHAFSGRTTERARIDVPMDQLVDGGPQDLTLAKDGPGRLYYRLGLRYAPKDLDLEPADRGFVVQRTYQPVDDPGDVVLREGTWHVQAGARVRVKITMVADSRRHHVALIDPLPAGLEAINPELATTGAIPEEEADQRPTGRWWWGPWYEHDNLRDERAEAFASLLWAGVYDYSYVARATTPGTFVVPPSKAEEMYEPETFGRGASDRMVIE